MSGPISRLFYVDDSGALDKGWIVYGWIEFPVEKWDEILKRWLGFRKSLVSKYGISVATELHTVKLIGGRGDAFEDVPQDIYPKNKEGWRLLGQQVVVDCLAAIQNLPGIEIGLAYAKTDARGVELAPVREDVYSRLVKIWDDQLRNQREFGLVAMDGDATDPIYRAAHRQLALQNRRIIEDPMFLDSKHSQWTQIADIIAWAGYRHINREPANEYAWQWFSEYLEPRNPAGQLDLTP